MMKVLIVDDDEFKIKKMLDLLKVEKKDFEFFIEKSLNSGMRRIRNEKFDLILLDMSMPTFDKNDSQNFDSYGGKTFLREMRRKKILTPVIVVTQYDIFGEGDSQKTAENLDEEFKLQFNNYIGLVKYSSINNDWKGYLLKLLGD